MISLMRTADIHSKRRVPHINYSLNFIDKVDKNLKNYVVDNGERVLSDKNIFQKIYKIPRKKTIFDFIRKSNIK